MNFSWLELRFHRIQSTYFWREIDLNCDFVEYSQYISGERLTWIAISWNIVNIFWREIDLSCDFVEYSQYILVDCLTWFVILRFTVNVCGLSVIFPSKRCLTHARRRFDAALTALKKDLVPPGFGCPVWMKIIPSHLIEHLADSQEQYQMAFIKCQYTDDYLRRKGKR